MKADIPIKRSAAARLYGWLDRRTGLGTMMHVSLDEPIPGGARLAYVFGSGLLFIFISQVITGLCLALYYVPSAQSAHTSVAYITKQVAAGAFIRSLHYYGSSAMIVVLLLHFLQTFLYGSYKGRREVLWLSGALLSFLVLGMGFTGYLLPWDQKAYFATAVGTNIVGQVPLIGQWLTELLRGGDTLGTLTLSRFYVAHVFLIPGAIFLFIGIHIALFRKAGPAGPISEDPVKPKLPPEGFYPRQVIMDMVFALLLVAGLGVLAYFHPVELGPIANPADTQFLPRPEWYYLPMFEWLKFWEGPKVVFAIVIVPGILALLFFLLPFLDRSLERRPWRRPIPLLGVAIVLLGMMYLGMKSHLDDEHDPSIASQLNIQAKQERAYSKAPFHPYIASPGSAVPIAPPGPVDPLVAQGKGIFTANGCSGCHGETGMGTPAAPGLAGVTTKYPTAQLISLLRNPNAKMRAGGMPAVDLSANDMSALVTYLGVIGTSAANVPAAYKVAEPQPAQEIKKAAAFPGIEHGTAAQSTNTGSTPEASRASIAEGRQMFQSHACFACHGTVGQGTARGPALASFIARRSDQEVASLLHDPTAKMRAGGMSPLMATPEQESSLIAYLRSLSPAPAVAPVASQNQSTGTTPPPATTVPETSTVAATPPKSTSTPSRTTPPAPAPSNTEVPKDMPGRAVFVANGCAACHGSAGEGTSFAPTLVGITRKYPDATLSSLLRHPNSKMRGGGMPAVTVNDAEMRQLIAYLSTLGKTAPVETSVAAIPSGGNSTQHQTSATPHTLEKAVNAKPLSPEARRGKQVFEHYACESCHGVEGLHGTVAAPGLAGTASILPAPMLENLLRHHSARMQQGGMPLTDMNAQDMKALVAYIRSLPSSAGKQ